MDEKECKKEFLERQDRRGVIDRFQEKLVSRKLLVWLTSTALMISGQMTPEIWSHISLAYIGSLGAAELVAAARGR